MWPSFYNILLLCFSWTCLAFPAKCEPIPDTQAQNGVSVAVATSVVVSSSSGKCEDLEELSNVIRAAVNLAYGGNLVNFNNVLKFVTSISQPNLIYVGLNSLYDELESNGDKHTAQMMTLTYYIRRAMSHVNKTDPLASHYVRLKRKIPSNIRSIMFGEHIRLVNVAVKEYMFESRDRVDGHRLILTYVPGVPSMQHVFYFSVQMEKRNQFTFTIRNNHFDHGSPMCQSSYLTEDRRKIVTCPKEGITSGMKWYVEPVANTTYFKITNYLDGTQLYSPSDKFLLDKERRYVFTWQKLDWGGGPEGYWIVKGI